MEAFLSYTLTGLFTGAAYAIAASGLVLTYTTTRVFNLAHGATSMVMAFVYWQLHIKEGLPTWLSLVLVLFVIAPLYGAVLERVVMRGLGDAPVSVSLVVTVGMFVLLIGLATQFWPQGTSANRYVPQFFGFQTFSIFGTRVSYHYLITILLSALVAAALYVLLNRTRIGTSMRAAVDNRELLQLFGGNANRVSMLSWAIGSSLAALAGVLLVSIVGLDYYNLTFLVINAFAAAMLGRLSSLPLTYLGAIVLGLLIAYSQGYVHGSQLIENGLQTSLPTLMLFAILIFVPQVRLRVGQVKGILAANVPSSRQSLISAVGLIVVVLVALQFLGLTNTQNLGAALVAGVVMLSLVLLTGYGGYVSLAQLTFFGVGAAVVAKANTTSPLAVGLAVLIAAGVGAVVAIPVLRLTGLYLALATLAFGQLMDKLVFQSDFLFGFGGSLTAKRMSLLGYDFNNTTVYVFFLLLVFLAIGIGVLALRRGPIGRLLIAMRDSPAACGTLGLNQRWFRVGLFSMSAAIAGLAGALSAGLSGIVSPKDFLTLQSLPLLLIAVVAGVTTVSGALVAGFMFMLLDVLPRTYPSVAGYEFLVIGFGAIMLASDPNGLVNLFYKVIRLVAPRIPLPPRLQRLVAAPVAAESVEDAEGVDDRYAVPEGQVAHRGVA